MFRTRFSYAYFYRYFFGSSGPAESARISANQ